MLILKDKKKKVLVLKRKEKGQQHRGCESCAAQHTVCFVHRTPTTGSLTYTCSKEVVTKVALANTNTTHN